MSFTARFGGRCAAECGERIKPGDVVEYVDDQLVHEGCVPAPVMERPAREQCPDCFTERSVTGACMCPEVAR